MGTAEIPITRRHYATKTLLEAGLIVNQEWGYVGDGTDHIGVRISDGTYRYFSRTELFPPGAGVTPFVEVKAAAVEIKADMIIDAAKDVDCHTNGAYLKPRRVSQSTIPTPDANELMIWRDSDDNKTYLVYNDEDEGVRSVEMT